MTLRTLADLGHALGRSFSIVPSSPGSRAMLDAVALRSLFAAFSATSDERHWISAETVDEHLLAAENVPVDVRDYHEYALAA